jgi:hypothetical protein
MGKLPSFQFYPGDWVQDTRALSLSAKGAWIDILCALWRSPNRGTLGLPLIGWARLIGATTETTTTALCELIELHTCDSNLTPDEVRAIGFGRVNEPGSNEVHGPGPNQVRNAALQKCNVEITLVNRRMVREERDRRGNALRQERYRVTRSSNANVTDKVTPPSSSSSSSSLHPPTPQRGNGRRVSPAEFDRFWQAYPRKEAKQDALKSFAKLNPDSALVDTMISWIGEAILSEQWKDKGKIPHPATWLNGRRWEGDTPPKPTGNGSRPQQACLPEDPPGSDPRPPKGMRWARGPDGTVIHPLRAVLV